MLKSPTINSLAAFFACIAMLAISACSSGPQRPTHKGDNNPGAGPFMVVAANAANPEWVVDDITPDKPNLIRVRNLMGDVIVRSSPDAKMRIETTMPDGRHPAMAELRFYQGSHHFFVLDRKDAIDDEAPELPTTNSSGGIVRLGLELPRVDVHVWLPENSILNVDACAALDFNADADVRVVAGTIVSATGGDGSMMAWAPMLDIESASLDIFAEIEKSANISGTHGAKVIRGAADVQISRGSGLLDVKVSGEVLTQTLVSGGMPRTNLQDFAHKDGFTPIGPDVSVFGTRGIAAEKARTGSRVQGKKVRVLLDATSRLEVDVTVSRGEVRLKPGDASHFTLHEWTNSTARFTVGNPTGELLVYATDLAEVLVEE